jgi:hypothetical protein
MAKFFCVCGHLIRISGDIPNPIEWRCLSDVEYDQFQGLVDVEDVYQRSTIFYRCPQSEHLWFFWDGLGEKPSLYSPTPLPEGWT